MRESETAWAIRDRYADALPLPPDRIAAILARAV
jgi:hypothetical protein